MKALLHCCSRPASARSGAVPTWIYTPYKPCPFGMNAKAKRYLLPFWNTSRVYMFPFLVADECGAVLFSFWRGGLGRDGVIGCAVG
jgi:hypothetical protein